MARYSVGAPASNSADINEATGVLWNPHSTIALRVYGIEVQHNSSVSGCTVSRVTTRGTPATTTTPDADNQWGRRNTPPSGALLDRGNYTVNPTVQTPPLLAFQLSGQVGSAINYWLPQPIIVPGGTGLALVLNTAATAWSYSFTWEE
jgi:hypothetical protein